MRSWKSEQMRRRKSRKKKRGSTYNVDGLDGFGQEVLILLQESDHTLKSTSRLMFVQTQFEVHTHHSEIRASVRQDNVEGRIALDIQKKTRWVRNSGKKRSKEEKSRPWSFGTNGRWLQGCGKYLEDQQSLA
jgi:predicted transcriptional regulator